MADIKISQLPEATEANGVFAQDAAGTGRTEQVSLDKITAAQKPTLDAYYADKDSTQTALDGKANVGVSYTKSEADSNFKSITAPQFMLYHNVDEVEAVSVGVYASPGDNIASHDINGFIYSGGGLECTVAGKYRVGAGISHQSSSTNTLFSFYWAKNWTTGAPTGADLNSIQQRLTGTSAGFLECTWQFDLEVGDKLDLVVTANKSVNITFLTGTKYYGSLA